MLSNDMSDEKNVKIFYGDTRTVIKMINDINFFKDVILINT